MRTAKPLLFGASLLLLLRLLLHLYLARYAVPAADDFCYAANAPHTPLLAWLGNEYHHWNGRYLSNVFVGRGPLQWGEHALLFYRLVPVVLLLTTLGALVVFVRTVITSMGRGAALLIALVLLLLFVDVMPDMGQGIYWYTGAITYQPGNVLLLAYVITLMRGRSALAALLLALTMGMSETHMLLALSITLLAFVLKKARRKRMIALLVSALACAAVVILAPGNAERAAFFTNGHRFFHSVGMTALQCGRFGLQWICSPALVFTSLAFVAWHPRIRKHVPQNVPALLVHPLVVAALLLAVLIGCIFPAYWAMGMLAQHRTLNVACFFFVPLWCWFLHCCLLRVDVRWPSWMQRASVGLAFLALLFTGNGWHALRDLTTGRAEAYAHAMDPPLEKRTIPDRPRTLCVLVPDGPEDEWMLQCERDYLLQRSQRSTEADKAIGEPFPR